MVRRLVICSDGTWQTAGAPDPTNVVKMHRLVAESGPDGMQQVAFYDPGVGTNPGLAKFTGGAFGQGLSDNVKDAYRFVTKEYQPGDDLFFFGFSRGAFTVRSTVGLIRKCGILKDSTQDGVAEAYRIYRLDEKPPPGENWKPADSPTATNFRDTFSHPREKITFVGVWDTVGALGIPGFLRGLTSGRYKFHDVQLSTWVRGAFQALAVDERREPFAPAIWQTQNAPEQEVEQAWFTGVHCDVGGGYHDRALADITFRWMAERAQRFGLVLKPEAFDGLSEDYRGRLHDSMTWYYKIFKNHPRAIGHEDYQPQAVSPSARERYFDAARDYKPANLKRFLEP